ncbi:hypothetical protein V6U78_05360 [Marinospirillum sp. MEB164]|uniref:Uncharacterized protein n=1 Tax=Marinospirillum alkalitolerans TaxID=3123374 RepID=A0ABW8PWU8_9GAMM
MLDYYNSSDFADLVSSNTLCGKNSWKRLMSWLDFDARFQGFMQIWLDDFSDYYHTENENAVAPCVDGVLEGFFDDLYPAQFILRLYELTDEARKRWILTSLSPEQQKILLLWVNDSMQDKKKAWLADNWTLPFEKEKNCKEISILKPLKSDVFSALSAALNSSTRRNR